MYKVVSKLLFVVAIFFFSVSSVYATDYYVAGDTGNDTTGNGSSGTPWKTIQKAADTMIAGDTVNVKGGLTYNDVGSANCSSTGYSAVVCPVNSGSSGNFITYQAWNGTGIPTITASTARVGFLIASKNYLKIQGFQIIISNATGTGIQVLTSSDNLIVANNIVRSTVTPSFNVSAFDFWGSTNLNVHNNTVYGLGFSISFHSGSTGSSNNNMLVNNLLGMNKDSALISVSGNYYLSFNNTYGDNNFNGANKVVLDPLFIDASNGDFHLQKTSPAIGAGTDLSGSGVTTDIFGVARPQGSGYDIGAYEYYDIPITLTTTPASPTNNTTPTIAGTASTIGAATISSVTYSVDSGSWVSTGVTGTSSFSIVVPALADGSHTIRVRATDSYGYVTDSTLYGTTTFTIDSTATSSPDIDSPSGYTKDNTRPTLIYKTVSSVSSYSVSLDSGKNKSYSTSGIPSAGTGVWKDDNEVKVEFLSDSKVSVFFKGLNNSELTEGKHTWNVTAYDSAGNSSSRSTDFQIDRTAPKLSELAIADVSAITQGSEYTLPVINRMPSFSGKVEDESRGSEKTNDNGTKDTFESVSSGYDLVTLTIKKLEKGVYVDHLTKDYPLTSDRFFVTTPYPLVDGYYEVSLTPKDKAGNTGTSTSFHLRLNYNGSSLVKKASTKTITPVNLIKEKVTNTIDTAKEKITQIMNPPTNTLQAENNQKPTPIQSFFSWVGNLFKSIFNK
ncbi:MAG: Ig-like domain-containing protein [Patescibacteria group bacterium]